MKHNISLFFSLVGVLILAGLLAFSTGGKVVSAATVRSQPSNAKGVFASKSLPSADVSPAKVMNSSVTREPCNGSDYLSIASEYDADIDCFAYAGTISVAIYYSEGIYSGNNTGWIKWDDGAGHYSYMNFAIKNNEFFIDYGRYVYRVDTIHID